MVHYLTPSPSASSNSSRIIVLVYLTLRLGHDLLHLLILAVGLLLAIRIALRLFLISIGVVVALALRVGPQVIVTKRSRLWHKVERDLCKPLSWRRKAHNLERLRQWRQRLAVELMRKVYKVLSC